MHLSQFFSLLNRCPDQPAASSQLQTLPTVFIEAPGQTRGTAEQSKPFVGVGLVLRYPDATQTFTDKSLRRHAHALRRTHGHTWHGSGILHTWSELMSE